MRHGPSLLLLLTLLPLLAQGQPQTYRYAMRDTALCLDVWRPAEPRADSACVVAVFGGGFVRGHRDNELQRSIARELTARGYTVVNIDYRLGLRDSARVAQEANLLHMNRLFQYCIDLAVEDCAEATRWVIDHAAELGVSPSHMVLTGSSAGAITVLQMDWCRANGLPQTATLPEGWCPAAVAAYSGAIQCRNSRLHYATPPSPTLFMHGTKDKIVAYRRLPSAWNRSFFGSKRVAREFRRRGYPYWFLSYEGIGHEVASFLPGSVEVFCAFADQAFKGRIERLDATVKDRLLVPTEWTSMTLIDLYK